MEEEEEVTSIGHVPALDQRSGLYYQEPCNASPHSQEDPPRAGGGAMICYTGKSWLVIDIEVLRMGICGDSFGIIF